MAAHDYVVSLQSRRRARAAARDFSQLTPWRLYRFVMPSTPSFLRRRDITFTGMMMNFDIQTNSQTQLLWINAYFLGHRLALPNVEDDVGTNRMPYEIILNNRFGKW